MPPLDDTLQASAILFGICGLFLVYRARGVRQWPWRLCAAILFSTVAAAALDLLESTALQRRSPLLLCRAVFLADTLAAPLPSLLMTAYFLWCCGEDFRGSLLMRAVCALAAALAAASTAEQLAGTLGVAQDYTLLDGSRVFHCLLLSIVIVTSAVCLAALFRRRKKLTGAQRAMFLACFLLSAPFQIILLELSLILGLLHRYLAQQEEAARQRTQVALAQMQPHFIHNTLTSIYYLCAQDPEKAQRVIRDFSRYLQSNFTAIAQEDTIPFEKELEHTKAYLAVEQARFEGRLFVEFDTPATFFRVPALTLQPIVENAVQHGLNPDRDPLRVSVRTEDTERGVRIIVEDTGPGFAPSEKPHITLDNVRERLRTLCGGTLDIAARQEGGTKVTLFVPNRCRANFRFTASANCDMIGDTPG